MDASYWLFYYSLLLAGTRGGGKFYSVCVCVCVCVRVCVCAHARTCTPSSLNSLQPHGLWPARILCPWSGLPFPTPGDLPDSGIKLASLAPPALA